MALSLSEEVEVVGEAGTGEEALHLAEELRPGVVVLDVSLPDMEGLEVAARLKRLPHPPRVIMLTVYDSPDVLARALRVGVDGYLLKDVDSQELLGALRLCAMGGTYIQPRLAGVLAGLMRESWAEKPAPLTPREREVLGLMAQGCANSEIARELGVSEKTVKNHISSILRKMNVRDRTAAVVAALRRGLVSLR